MSITCDFRKKELRNCKYVFLAVRPGLYHYAKSTGEVFADVDSARKSIINREDGFVIKLHRRSIEKLRKMHPLNRGMYLSFYLMNRNEY